MRVRCAVRIIFQLLQGKTMTKESELSTEWTMMPPTRNHYIALSIDLR